MRLPSLKTNFNITRRGGGTAVGLDIQPGFAAAVQVRSNGGIVAERAATIELAADTVRDGEVADAGALSDALRELFSGSGLGRRVRVGIANQRTVLRILELPPLTDRKELAAAVTFQAQEQVPMPLNNAVLDFQPLGIIDTPAGPRQRVALVAAQRDMVERLLAAVRGAGLIAEGVDLSAFALIRSLYRPLEESAGRVLYLNVDGLTNLAIAEGTVCHFTRVVGSGLEGMAGELAARLGVSVAEAHELLAGVDLGTEAASAEIAPARAYSPIAGADAPAAGADARDGADGADAGEDAHVDDGEDAGAPTLSPEEHEAPERDMSFAQPTELPASDPAAPAKDAASEAVAREVLENGVREIASEVRNSIDFHRSQDGGGEVSRVVLSGAAQNITGFAETLQQALGVEVHGESVGVADEHLAGSPERQRLAVATGLAAAEVAQ